MRNAKIKASNRQFFYYWVMLTDPLKKIPHMQRNMIAELLYYRSELLSQVKNPALVDQLLFEYETKGEICKSLGITRGRFAIELTKLRKRNVIVGKQFNPIYVPNFEKGDKEFVISYTIEIHNEEKSSKGPDSSSDEESSEGE
jgi:uncharacterized protein YqkB